MTILILSLVIAGIVIVTFFVVKHLVKKNKMLQLKVDYAEKEFEQVNKNIKNYKLIIEKLNKKKVESAKVKNNIANATGGELTALANSL